MVVLTSAGNDSTLGSDPHHLKDLHLGANIHVCQPLDIDTPILFLVDGQVVILRYVNIIDSVSIQLQAQYTIQ